MYNVLINLGYYSIGTLGTKAYKIWKLNIQLHWQEPGLWKESEHKVRRVDDLTHTPCPAYQMLHILGHLITLVSFEDDTKDVNQITQNLWGLPVATAKSTQVSVVKTNIFTRLIPPPCTKLNSQ